MLDLTDCSSNADIVAIYWTHTDWKYLFNLDSPCISHQHCSSTSPATVHSRLIHLIIMKFNLIFDPDNLLTFMPMSTIFKILLLANGPSKTSSVPEYISEENELITVELNEWSEPVFWRVFVDNSLWSPVHSDPRLPVLSIAVSVLSIVHLNLRTQERRTVDCWKHRYYTRQWHRNTQLLHHESYNLRTIRNNELHHHQLCQLHTGSNR